MKPLFITILPVVLLFSLLGCSVKPKNNPTTQAINLYNSNCGQRNCELSCEFGFILDSNNCQRCACRTQTCECTDTNTDAQVCGRDGNTYSSACRARCKGIPVAYPGPCISKCLCTRQYQPVCGSDNRTYINPCIANCHGITLQNSGPCSERCAPLSCTIYCDNGFKRDTNGCEICECRPATATCSCDSAVYAPVCGEDRHTYPNTCNAHCAGVPVLYPGECRNTCGLDFICDLDCPDGGYAHDERGCKICRCEGPCPCPQVEDPVCGENWITYQNACEARCHGVRVLSQGKCPENCNCPTALEPVCGLQESNLTRSFINACQARCQGARILYNRLCNPETECPAPGACDLENCKLVKDSNGCDTCRCEPTCTCTDAGYDPVCGANGETYPNNCEAQCAGVTVEYRGACTVPCPDMNTCTKSCPGGYVIDSNGCKLCECKDACDACTTDYRPVCCKNADSTQLETPRTYGNQCTAECAGCKEWSDGACPTRTNGCDSCPADVRREVCGRDGNTYANRCMAEECHHVEVAYESRCGDCPPVTCALYCEYGYKKDGTTGCETCACNEEPSRCGPNLPPCPTGLVCVAQDDNGTISVQDGICKRQTSSSISNP